MTLLARIFVVSLCLFSWSPAFATIVQFDWLGVGAPGLQSFTVIDTTDPFLSAPLDQGTTVNANAPGIPEPSTPLLMLVALGVFYRQWKKLPD